MLVSLNAEFISRQLVCPPGKHRIEYVDKDGVRGLYVEVRASRNGEGVYYLRSKVQGRLVHQRIGSTKDVSLVDARRRAKQLKAEILLGADPRAAAQAKKAVPTFSEFYSQHYEPYVTPRKRSVKRDAEIFRLHVAPKLGNSRLDSITRQQVQAIMTDMIGRGLSFGSADLVGRFVRHALNLAVDWKLISVNPTVRLPMFNHDSRVAHYLDDAQLDRLMGVLRTDENVAVCQIALFLLSTGCRLNEALSAKWSDVDIENRVLAIRARNSKSKRMRSVPLNDSALEVLASVHTENEYEYLFVNRRTGRPYVAIAKVWGRLRNKAGLPHLRLHDLRHSFASFLVNGGRTLYEVQQILGHSDSKVTQRYAHLSTKTLQEAANSASVKILGEPKSAA